MKWLAQYAWLGGSTPAHRVLITTEGDRIVGIQPNSVDPDAQYLPGLTMPGFANAHSHAFHRALRGRTHGEQGTFWTWRSLMYRAADRLTPDNYYLLCQAVFSEMLLAGITCVGEFHYVHHAPGGVRYRDKTSMEQAVMAAAVAVGIRLTLLDTCYLAGGIGQGLEPSQVRFSDGSVDGWIDRHGHLKSVDALIRIGGAVHSIRAVPAHALNQIAEHCAGIPLHAHVSEQPAENEQCRQQYGTTPVELLARHNVLGPNFTAVHATHLTEQDIGLLASTGSQVCLCPTTERDLADGIGPAGSLSTQGVSLNLGSDSHAIIDFSEEARAVELNERLATGKRGTFAASALAGMATANGYRSLGWSDGGRLEVGALADFITIDANSVRMSGLNVDNLVAGAMFSATASDVTTVVVGGKNVTPRPIPGLRKAITELLDGA